MALRLVPVALALALLGTALCASAASSDSGALLSAVKNVTAQEDKFRSLMSNLSYSQFKFISVSSVLGSSDEASFQNTVRKNSGQIADLRTMLGFATLTGEDGVVTTLKKVMTSQNVSIDRVIAVYVDPSNQVTVYYQ